jgi:hypothetical protein
MMRCRAVLRVFGGKVSLGALCAAAGCAAVWESWSVALAGIAVIAGLVLWDVRASSKKLLKRPPHLPDGTTFKHGLVRSVMEAISSAQKERMEVADACPSELVTVLEGVMRTAADVETAALCLARRTDSLYDYLSTKNAAHVRTALVAAQEAASAARTPPERESYEAAAQAYAIEADALGSIDMALRVGLARLESIRAMLVAIPSRIVKLQTASAGMNDASFQRITGELRIAGNELDETERHFRELCVGEGKDGDLADAHVRIAVEREPRALAALALAESALEMEERCAAAQWGSHRLHI